MKNKEGIKGLRPGILIVIYAVAAVAAIVLRMYQMLHLIDPSTGFYTDPGNITVIALYAVVGAAILMLLVLSRLSGSLPFPKAPEGRHILTGLAAIALAGGMGYEAYSAFKLSGDPSLVLNGMSSASVVYPLRAEAVCAVLSAVYFLLFAAASFMGKPLFEKLRLLALCPVVFEICRLIHRFTRTISFIKVSELLAELVGIGLAMLFFMEAARINSAVMPGRSAKTMFGAGLSASLVMLTYSVPRLILVLTGSSDLLVVRSDFFPVDLATGIFIPIFLFAWLRNGAAEATEREIPTAPLPADERPGA